MRIVVNAITAKKNAGGAFQISNNFIKESLADKDVEWYWWVSKDLDEVLGDIFAEYRNNRYFVFPTQPDFKNTYFKVKKELRVLEKNIGPDLIYSITAPSYFKYSSLEVMRFTNPYVTHLNKYAWSLVPFSIKIRSVFYHWFQRRMIMKINYFITQSQTCKEGIIRITGVEDNHVQVVSNVLPAAYREAERSHLSEIGRWVDIACIGAPFYHKNFDIIPDVLRELRNMGLDNVRFHVTIPEDNPLYINIVQRLDECDLKDRVITHGRCTQQYLINVYRHCMLCFQPTLLEVFSASAIESMYFRLPTVATKLPFNQEVYQDSCLYYEPLNAYEAAKQFAKLINDEELRIELCKQMEGRLAVYGDYGNHFNSTKEFLIKVAKKEL